RWFSHRYVCLVSVYVLALGRATYTLSLHDALPILREAQAARESLSTQVLQEGATERSRIALDLYDVVLPSLAAAEIQADNISSRSEEHTSELQSREKLVCRLLLEKKNDVVPLGRAE